MGWIIQLALTAGAFFRGWRWYALIPLAVVVAIGFVAGLGFSAAGVSLVGWPTGILVTLDALSMIILIIMCIWVHPVIKAKRQKAETNTAEEA
jgi:hypothetical protein